MKKLTEFNYSHALVLGLAKSGTAAAELLLNSGINVRINDKLATQTDDVVVKLKEMGAEVIVGSHPLSVLDTVDVVIKNPGIPYDNPVVAEAEKREIPILTEIEFANELATGNIIAISGSNGKTTTTTLATNMIAESNLPVKVAGNIGKVATEVAQTLTDEETLVLELSSFQLMGIREFQPKIAVLLNIYEAHLDYHKTMANYKRAKYNIFRNQTSEDYLVYNDDDPNLREAALEAKSVKVPFSITKQLETGAWADSTSIYFGNEKIMDKQDILLVGDHNIENMLAAICAAKLNGASTKAIQKVLQTFSGVEHRFQFVARIADRLFYNDSKGTNILATQKALSSFKQPTILLAGGLDRGNGFDDLLPYLKNVKAMVLFGQTKMKLKELADKAGITKVTFAKDVTDAVDKAYALSNPKDVILLSPACASWDQYRSFEERGDMFIQAVHTLE
ncbi:UDP-N-acetylmuramoyl-L-alanine--D-glutamate ligase [Virgibacillus phasianinus]|uniref:UDP-N-acetylmuramoylalanine--D-glutamate ligase n=1 Tax=Virgibacillus phasianinus TaxID=2017483 RepID=A0A220U6H8_9BACI|nr:UDP-N-acetylmuramoyl-L-alanine--D-glutamate ligase [Virgibacillus phasianinus]ASK63582.1 UDP-N-acetylmuramoyl-L-alanine--D-glutamate ligase [Virgibacillus phasianinus]